MLQSKAVSETVDGAAHSWPGRLGQDDRARALGGRNSNFRRDSFDAATAALGLTITPPHNLRDTAASLAIEAGPGSLRLRAYLAIHGLPDMPGSPAAPLGVAVCRDFRWVCALSLAADGVVSGESGHVRLLVGGQLAPGWRTSNLRIGGHDLGPRHARCE